MLEAGARVRKNIPEETMLSRLAQSEQMREFFIQMWMQNPGLAKQGGTKVQDLMAKLGGDAPPVFPQQPPIMERTKQRGISLVELIMFIVIVSVALAGILLVMNVTNKNSADPLIHKQSLAIAEALLEEVELMPFTYCDPDDPAASLSTTTSTAACAQIENLGPESAFGAQTSNELRYGPSFFDNVNDYAGTTAGAPGFAMNAGNGGIKDITGTAMTALNGYSAVVSMTQPGLGTIAAADTLLINVTVTGTDGVPVTLEGYRTRYAPRTVP